MNSTYLPAIAGRWPMTRRSRCATRSRTGAVNQRSAARSHDDKPRDQRAIAGGVSSAHLGSDRPARFADRTGCECGFKVDEEAGCLARWTLLNQLNLAHPARNATRVAAHLEVTVNFPTITTVAIAATFFAASLANAEPVPRRGHNAYGSAAPLAAVSPSESNGARASALRQCNNAVANMFEYAWGVQRSAAYTTCMTSHAQVE
jgi:hypothetical protein